MNKRSIKLFIIISIVLIFVGSSFAIAKSIQKHSYDSREIVYENYVREVLPSMVEDEVSENSSEVVLDEGGVVRC